MLQSIYIYVFISIDTLDYYWKSKEECHVFSFYVLRDVDHPYGAGVGAKVLSVKGCAFLFPSLSTIYFIISLLHSYLLWLT